MNGAPTIELIRQRYATVDAVAEGLVRAEQHYNSKPVGIFYFDFGDAVLQEEFDLVAYSQRLIAPDFYRREGSLQWNFYLYFVVERAAFDRLRATERINQIESDRTYARKFVRDQEALNAELAAPLANLLYSTRPKQDLASLWTEKLIAAGLSRVADPDASYDASVRDIIAGRTTAAPQVPRPTATPAPGRFIQSVRLDTFRDHPTRREFDFATVNLLRGVNGVGKTSLLEAIELSICGGIRRQGGTRPSRAKLQVHFAGLPRAEVCPTTDLAIYRSRDLHWYGGYSRSGNQLCHNFARFNFYDSDAAVRLSTTDDPKEIVKALDSLLLGERATSIEERMKQFQVRLRDQESNLRRLRVKHEQDRSKASNQLEELKAIKDTSEALSRELQAKARDCGWLRLADPFSVSGLAVMQEEVEELTELLGQHVERLPWMSRISISTLSRDARKLAETLKNLTDQRKLLKANQSALEQADTRITGTSERLRLLQRLSEYHDRSDGMTVLGGKTAIKEAKARVAMLKEAATHVRGLDLAKYAETTATLAELARQQAAETAKRRKTLAKLNTRVAELRAQVGDLKTVAQEIKGLGERFCQLSPHSTDCPLCGAHYQRLADQIAKIEFSPPLEAAVRDVTVEISQEEAELQKLASAAATVTRLSEAARLALPAAHSDSRSVAAIALSLATIGEQHAAAKLKLDELVATHQRLELAGYSEKELEALLESAAENHALARSRLIKKEGTQTLVTQTNEALEKLRGSRRDDLKQQKEIDAEIRRIVRNVDNELAPEGADIEFERREAVMEAVLKSLHAAKKSVTLSDSGDISTAQAHLASFANSLRRIQEALKRVEQKDKLEEGAAATLATAQTELARIVPQHEHAKAAVGVLSDLLGSDYKAAFTQQVLVEHQEKISAIFSRIHSPREFKAVHLAPNFLLERFTNMTSSIAEISSGQRAALALSIFLSLNASVSEKAPWLIFDDPIVHVDDLNILSFLDVLRDLVLVGRRQVFFATANTRMADLFTKKFDCLAAEFQPIPLAR